jgi:hypothetical protein
MSFIEEMKKVQFNRQKQFSYYKTKMKNSRLQTFLDSFRKIQIPDCSFI